MNESLSMDFKEDFKKDLYDAISEVCYSYKGADLTEDDIIDGFRFFIMNFFNLQDEEEVDTIIKSLWS